MRYFKVEFVAAPSELPTPIIAGKFEGVRAKDSSDAVKAVKALLPFFDFEKRFRIIVVTEM